MKTDDVLVHLKNLVEIYPQTSNQDSVKQVLEYCANVLSQTGAIDDIQMHTSGGFHSLTASTQSTKIPKVLLQAHVDVVSSLEAPKMEIIGDKITGRGSYDMLFAVASYLVFAQQHSDKLSELDFGIMLTGDEEIGGFNGVGYLTDEGYGAEIVFLPDAGEGFGDLSIAAKGAYNFDLVAVGKAHHGSRPWEGDGAANKLILMLHDLMDGFDTSDKHNSTITVTRFDGGGAINRGPRTACAHVDIRYKHVEDYKQIKQKVAEICNEYGGEIQNLLEADSLEIDTTNKHLQDFAKLYSAHTGKEVTFSKAHGGSDARFFAKKGTPVILIRPDGSGAHSDDEQVSISSLDRFNNLLEDFILKTAKIK